MTRWVFALALAISAGADTRIVDTLYRPDGSKANGTLQITCQQVISGGRYVVRDTLSYKVVDGAVDVTLVPGATCSVVYSTQRQPFSRTWVIPESASPVRIGDVEGTVPVSPRATFTASQITGGVLAPERLGSGTAGADTTLRGNGQWVRSSFTVHFDLSSYSTGTVAIANGGTTVTGIGTQWTPEMSGWEIIVPSGCEFAYRFEYVSPTSGKIEAPYGCASTPTLEPASVVGTAVEPFDIQADVNDRLMLWVDGVKYPITLSAGEGRTAADVAAEISSLLSAAGASATAETSERSIVLRSATASGASRLGVIEDSWANGAAATLGLPVGTTVGGIGAAYVLVEPLLISGAVHQLGTSELALKCFARNSGVPLNDLAAVAISPTTFDVKVLPFGTMSGRCVIWR